MMRIASEPTVSMSRFRTSGGSGPVSMATRPVPESWIAASLDVVEEEGEYELTAERASTLRAILALCQEAGVPILLFEIPMSRDLVRLLPMGTMEIFRHAARGLAKQADVPFVELENLGLVFEDEDFYEASHLNLRGARKLTRALSEQVLLPTLRGQEPR